MGVPYFAVALVVGAAVLAWWLDMRFERRRPASPVARMTHAVAAFVLIRLVAAVTTGLLGTDASGAARVLVILGLVLPGLVYAFVTGLWLMRTLAEAARVWGR